MQISGSPSGWEFYYVVFLSALVALGIPLVLSAVSIILSRRAKRDRKEAATIAAQADPFQNTSQTLAQIPSSAAPKDADSTLGRRINTRFFLSANASLILIALALVLIPYAGVLTLRPDGQNRALILRGLISVVSIAGFAALGLFYSARKGDLNWLQSYRSPREEKEAES